MSVFVIPLRCSVVTAYALHHGYTVEPISWEGSWEDELAEGWQWTCPDGMARHDRVEALIDGFPVLPEDLTRKLDASYPMG